MYIYIYIYIYVYVYDEFNKECGSNSTHGEGGAGTHNLRCLTRSSRVWMNVYISIYIYRQMINNE